MTDNSAYQGFSLGLKLYKPAGDPYGFLPHPLSIQAAFPESDVPSLIFTYPKDSAAAELLLNQRAGFEVALMLYIPTLRHWIEPMQGRFMALQWEDDVADETNVIKFTCPGIAWNLSKQLVFKGKNDDKLNAAEKAAIEAHEKAQNDLRSKESALNSNLSLVKSEMRYKGGTYCLHYFPRTVKSGSKYVKPKNKSILYHTGRKKFYWYKASTGKWYTITKKEVTNRITDTANKAAAVSTARAVEDRTKVSRDRAVRAAREATKSGKRPMLNTTAGWAMKRHWDEAKARGGNRMLGMARGFNGTYATGANGTMSKTKWPSRFAIDLTIGMSLLDLLKQLSEMGVAEWVFRQRKLALMKPGTLGVDVSAQVGLHLGKDLKEAPDKATLHDFANYLLVRGEDNLSFGMSNSKSDPAVGWGTWERALSASGAKKTADAKKAVAGEAKQSQKRLKIESTRQLIIHPETPLPMYHYQPGNYIGIYGTDGTMQKVRIKQISLIADDEGTVSGALILGDRFRSTALDFRRSLNTTVGGYEKTIGGGTVPLLPGPDGRVPAKAKTPPPSLAIAARTGINEATGASSTILSLAWAPPGDEAFERMDASEEPDDGDIDPDELVPDY